MKIQLNERTIEIEAGQTAFGVRKSYKPEADVVICNGFLLKDDRVLEAEDSLVLIVRGAMPSHEELEVLMVSRHTTGVHERVKKAHVAIAGLGGLGSNIAVALARTGVGKMTLLDFDVVEPSNLNRQHYMIRHIGMKKTKALRAQIQEINPFIEVETHDVFLERENLMTYLGDADVAVEAFDGAASKAMMVSEWIRCRPDRPIVAASGVAGYGSSNEVLTSNPMGQVYLVGDSVSEARIGEGLMAPRVSVAAGHQANMVLRLIMDLQRP